MGTRNGLEGRVLLSTWALSLGGVGSFVLRLMAGLKTLGLQPQLCCLVAKDDLVREFDDAGHDVVCLGHRGKADVVRTIRRSASLIRDTRAQLVHTNQPLDGLLISPVARLLGVPVLRTLHSIDPAPAIKEASLRVSVSRTRPSEFLQRRSTTQYVAVSQAVRNRYANVWGVPRESIEVIHHGIDLESVRALPDSTLRQELGVDSDTPLIGAIGRLVEDKGFDLLVPLMLRVRKYLPDARLLIIGDGPLRTALESMVSTAGLRNEIRFLGLRSAIPSLIQAMDLVVVPSRSEGFGQVLIESGAVATPVVASRLPATEEVVSDGETGILFDPEDVDALAKAVLSILTQPVFRRQLGVAAQNRVEREFDIRQMATAYAKIYGDLAKASSGHRGL